MTISYDNISKRRVVTQTSLPAEAPDCPKDLRGAARKEWGRVVPLLDEAGLISKVDRGMLELYCRFYAMSIEALDDVANEGVIVQTASGSDIKNPKILIAKEAANTAAALAKQLGLSPASRRGIPSNKKPDANKGDDILNS